MANWIVNLFKQQPPDGTYEDAARRQAYAEALQKSAMRSRMPQQGGPVQVQMGIGEGLTQLAEALLARRAGKSATKAQDVYKQNLGQAIDRYGKAVSDDQTGAAALQAIRNAPENQLIDPVYGKTEARNNLASVAGLDTQRAMAQGLIEQGMEQPKPPEPYTLGVGERRFGGNNQLLAEGAEKETPDQWRTKDEVLPNGMMQTYAFNQTTREYEPVGKPYKPIDKKPNISINNGRQLPPRWVQTQDPNDPTQLVWTDLNNQSAPTVPSGKETAKGKRINERSFGMEGLNAALDESEALLSGKVWDAKTGTVVEGAKGPEPTESPLGQGARVAVRFVGYSSPGSQVAARLEALGGALTSKVPRFEGPQSNYDVELYKEMAAKIGNPTIPVEDRLAALRTVRGLFAKYEQTNTQYAASPMGFASTSAPTAAPAAPTPVGNGLTPEEAAELAELKKRFGR